MTEPTAPAAALWAALIQWQPATAAALADHLRGLPDDWLLRELNVGRLDAALALPPGATGEQFPDRAPEIAPFDEIASLDDCPACEEAEGSCRFHQGYAAGHHELAQAQRDAVKARPGISLREFMLWQADVAEAADRGETAPELPATSADPTSTVLAEVQAERRRQDARWGEQNHPNGTGGTEARRIAETARATCQAAAERGIVTWLHISDEEHCEALAETDLVKLRAELVQDAAVKVAWIEAIDRRAAARAEGSDH